MIDILEYSIEILTAARFEVDRISFDSRAALVFEDSTVFGFLFSYDDARHLSSAWTADESLAVSAYQLMLRRAGHKAWNTYLILLAGGHIEHSDAAALSIIEENLERTRKIARGGMGDVTDVRAALLPLLPLQSAPRLDAVDMLAEIRERTTEIAPRAVDLFLSHGDDLAAVLHALEEPS